MTVKSNVNPNFPIPGIDQDSRGFRDNFATIKTEIENLQSKSIQIVGTVLSGPVQLGAGNGTVVLNIAGNLGAVGGNLTVPFNNNGAFAGSTIFYSNGRVGINTSTPNVALDILGNVNVTGYSGGTRIFIGPNLKIGSNSFASNITVNGSNAITILNSNHFVGIGDIIPTDVLTVNGNVKIPKTNAGILFSDGTFQNTAFNNNTTIFNCISTTSNISVSNTNYTILSDTTTGNILVTLPQNPVNGKIFNIKKISTDTNQLTIFPNGYNIEGSSSNISITSAGRPNYQLQFHTSTGWWLL